jgi:hypothetical protein
MDKNTRIIVVTAIVAVTVLCLAVAVVGIVFFGPRAPQVAVAEQPDGSETVVVEEGNGNSTVEKPATVSGSGMSKTYFPEYSCSDLASCPINEVPEGVFTIGFKKVVGGCDWFLFETGEVIDFTIIDEFHSYNAGLPLTSLDGFVQSQFRDVWACQH